ncbi:MAG: 16S rRNA (cytosine(1402)-N(4))-methyltransferase RsmH [Pirellula sp.]|jgi:16S rRNA (cytosine1402-N4)-methyltransferase
MPSIHIPVLLEPILSQWLTGLSPQKRDRRGLVIVDGTFGGGGHTLEISKRLSAGDWIIGIDRDPQAILDFIASHPEFSATDSSPFPEPRGWSSHSLVLPSGCRLLLACGSYCNLPSLLEALGIRSVHGILLDLGLSSDQLADERRGFSFRIDGPLDLRFDPSVGVPASRWLQTHTEAQIADAIYELGEERFSRRIARAIVEQNRSNPIGTSKQLADLIHRVVPGRVHGRVDSATRTFQALRIVVNRELEHVQAGLERLPGVLSLPGGQAQETTAEGTTEPAGRLAVISFHSLEDRMVKNAMRDDPRLKNLTKKPLVASESELAANPRSRSAKLRIAERQA